MLRLPETYPWDRVFDGDAARSCKLRAMPWELFREVAEVQYGENSRFVYGDYYDYHWSDDVQHWGGENEDQDG